MRRLLSVSVTAGADATGRIAAQTCRGALDAGWEVLLCYGRGDAPADIPSFSIADRPGMILHGLATRLTDRHGLHSARATHRLIGRIESFKPDVVHLHNIHGYYLNYPLLFEYLARTGIPTVWTLHDCWAMTGHCASVRDCRRWLEGCGGHCPGRRDYPASLLLSASAANFVRKECAFNRPGLNLTIVGVSEWTSAMARQSLLRNHPIVTIPNGVDTSIFTPDAAPKPSAHERPILLGVARNWAVKGGADFARLAEDLPSHWRIRLVGLTGSEARQMPERVEVVPYIRHPRQLAAEYSQATVFANLTYADTCALTQLEAMACGTPVVAYATGGAPESVTPLTGRVVAPGSDNATILQAIAEAATLNPADCRSHALSRYSLRAMQSAYTTLYTSLAR